ncbi:Protein FAM75A6 [Pteropus alecto]|uniref:Protein FAM75A6 n=1 Tax=Pteropus alecto TaxID=9402 RepID=L5KUF2_PTEAL|nr:Protein FAM75A6 [Pteropus alecto]
MDLGKDVGHNVGRIIKGLQRGSASCPVKVLRVSYEESERDLLKTLTKYPETVLTVHSVRKSGQISEGRIPIDVHHSRIAANHALDLPRESNAHRENRNPAYSKSWESCMNTSHEVFIRRQHARQLLEAHIKRFWVRHRWGLPLMFLKPVKLFKLKKAQPSPLRWSFFTHSATSASGAHSKAKFTKFGGKPPQFHSGEEFLTEESVPSPQLFPGDRVISDDSVPGLQPLLRDKVITVESMPTLVSPLLAPSTACEEIQKDVVERPPSDDHGSSESPLIGQMGRVSSQSLTCPFVGRIWHSEIAMEVETDSLNQIQVQWCPRMSQGRRVEVRPHETLKWSSLRVPIFKSQRSQEGRVSRVENHPQGHTVTLFLQDCETCLLLQNCATDILPQGFHSDVFLVADVLSFQGSQFSSKSISGGDMSASKVLYDFISSRGSSQQESLKLQDKSKSQSKMFVRTYEKENNRQPKPGEHKERLAEMRTSQDSGVSAALGKKSEESLKEKSFQLMQKEQPPPESFLKNSIKYFLQ